MGQATSISWTDHTFNPWIGCTKVSAGCDHCYAQTLNHRWGSDNWGKGKPRRVTSDANWKLPLKWNQDAFNAGVQRRVFCASMADVMDDEAPEGQRERLWNLIDRTPYLTWQLLTKRPHRYNRYLPDSFKWGNVWLGTSTEDQHNFDIRWPIVANVAPKYNAIGWISYEPALGPLMVTNAIDDVPDWVICGGESGAGRRPMEQAWAEALCAECEDRGSAFFMKQMSAQTPAKGSSLIPAHLLIRQFPEAR